MTSKIIKGHIRSVKLNSFIHVSTDFDKISLNSNVMKIKFFLKIKYDIRSHRTTFMLMKGRILTSRFADHKKTLTR